MSTFYKILEVSKSASAAEIKSSYRRLAKAYHPDRNYGDTTKEAMFKQVQAAYETLRDPTKRASYDLKLSFEEAARAEAAKRADAEATRRAEVETRTRARPMRDGRAPVPAASSSGNRLGGALLVGAGLGLLGLVAASLSANRGTYWDPEVQRYRGRDGRFR